jgi:hypothetical protein
MRGGRRVGDPVSLAESRHRAARDLRSLPDAFRGLEPGSPYPVAIAPALRELARQVDERLAATA